MDATTLVDARRENALLAVGIEKRFGAFTAVKGGNLAVRANSTHALIGPNGAGKTTIFNLLTKLHSPSRGAIYFEGRDITRARTPDIARMGMVRSFQISAVFGAMTVRENLRVALQRRAGLATQFWRPLAALRVLDERAAELAAQVGLERQFDTVVNRLSYGRKRALELATTFALDPRLLLLDEPMAGLAHEDIGQITELIRSMAQGRTVLMIEHNLPVVERLCGTITVLQRGQILAEGDYAAVSANPEVRRAYLGEDDD